MWNNKFFLLLLMASTCFFNHLKAQTNTASTYEIVPGKNDSDIVYRGVLTFDDIKLVPAFNFNNSVKEYKPKASVIRDLSKSLNHYKLVVFLGTWCSDSHIMIPDLYKILSLTGYPIDNVSLTALDRDKHANANQEAPYKIMLVPTVIVLKDGKEIGRITEMPKKSIEKDLLDIISR